MRKQTWIFFGVYLILRIFSYFFSPDTPLYSSHPVNEIATALIIITAIYWFFKQDNRAWYLIALELILGGAGGFLALQGIALRTWLLIIAVLFYVFRIISQKRWRSVYVENRLIILSFTLLWFVALLASLNGLKNGHLPAAVVADLLPYCFLFYYFPARELILLPNFKKTIVAMIIAAILGNTLLIIFTFVGFSSGIFVLQDTYYHWYRDVALGKITDLGAHFYRLVLNEHLLLAPLLLIFTARWADRDKTISLIPLLITALLVILSVNLTRAYFLGLVLGLLLLFRRTNLKRSFLVSGTIILGFIACFTSIHLAASRWQSPGWEILGLRAGSIAMPTSENSSLSRMLLLPEIWKKISASPLWGNGLGDTVRAWSPIHEAFVVTPHFDWGYLEIWAEMGLVGLIVWFLLLLNIFIRLKRYPNKKSLLASFLCLLVINITSPALFHVMGILWLVILLLPAPPNVTTGASK